MFALLEQRDLTGLKASSKSDLTIYKRFIFVHLALMLVTLVQWISLSALTVGSSSGMWEEPRGVFLLWTSTMGTNPRPHLKQVKSHLASFIKSHEDNCDLIFTLNSLENLLQFVVISYIWTEKHYWKYLFIMCIL